MTHEELSGICYNIFMLTNRLHPNYKPVQLILPVDYERIIDDCDPVVSFLEVVRGLNLVQYINTSNKVRQEYNPETMLHLILFGYMENVRSLRDLEKACRNDIRFMYLGESIKPSFMAFQRFIDTKLTASIDDIFYAVNNYLIEAEDIDTDILYVDGTKIEANARKTSFVWKKAILNHQSNLYLKVSKLLIQIENEFDIQSVIKDVYSVEDLESSITQLRHCIEDNQVQFVFGKGSRKSPYQRVYEHLVSYQNKLEAYVKHLEICGQRNSYSKTDHDATFMHGKEDYYNKTGIFKPYYNVQIGVSDEYILHYGVYPNPTDTKTWIPFMETMKARYGFLPSKPVADAGYGSYDNYMYNLENEMALTMKYSMFSKEDESSFKKKLYNIKNMKDYGDRLESNDGHVYDYSHDNEDTRGNYLRIRQIYKHSNWDESMKELGIPKSITKDVVLNELQNTAKEKLKSDEGIQTRIQRSIQVEGAFAEIKSNTEYKRIQRRGNKRVKTDICMVIMGYNLKKFHSKKYRVKH